VKSLNGRGRSLASAHRIDEPLERYDDGLQNTHRRVCGPVVGMKSFWSGEETRRSGSSPLRGKVVGSNPTGPTNIVILFLRNYFCRNCFSRSY